MVLKDHIRRGRKLIPPILDMRTPIQETVWHVERLPELFWLAFVGNRIGDRRTLDLAYEMAVAVEATIKRLRANDKAFRAYILSEHDTCSDTERKQIVVEHSGSAWLRELQPHFADMGVLWRYLPVGYLVSAPADESAKPRVVSEVKGMLRACFHRHAKGALIVQASTVALELLTNKLFVAEGLDIPDLNAIFDYPETEESQHAASFVVTTCSMTVLARQGTAGASRFTWPRSFWNDCYRQERCEHE